MHYYIDIVAHTTAFDTPVVEHWLGKSLTQQYTLNLSQLWDNQGWMPRPGIEPGSPAQETEQIVWNDYVTNPNPNPNHNPDRTLLGL